MVPNRAQPLSKFFAVDGHVIRLSAIALGILDVCSADAGAQRVITLRMAGLGRMRRSPVRSGRGGDGVLMAGALSGRESEREGA